MKGKRTINVEMFENKTKGNKNLKNQKCILKKVVKM